MATQFWFTKSNAARALDLSKRTLERYIAVGAIPVRRCGRKVYIPAGSLQDFAQHDHPAPAVFSPAFGKPPVPQVDALEAR